MASRFNLPGWRFSDSFELFPAAWPDDSLVFPSLEVASSPDLDCFLRREGTVFSETVVSFLDLDFGTGSIPLDVGFAGRSIFAEGSSDDPSLVIIAVAPFVTCDGTTGTIGLTVVKGPGFF